MAYQALLTNTGRNKEAAALANGTPLEVTEVAWGDGDRVPSGGETELQNEQGRKAVTTKEIPPDNLNAARFEVLIDETEGPYIIREAGLFDEDGDMIAIAHFDPPVNKPLDHGKVLLGLTVVFSDLENLVISVKASSAYVPASRTLTAGDGLLGGGDLSADRRFDVDFADEADLENRRADAVISAAMLQAKLGELRLSADLTLTVGPGGDFVTINDALAYASEHRVAYLTGGVAVEVKLLSGYVMAEQVYLDGVNLGWVTIVSEDDVVAIDRAALTTEILSAYPAFTAANGGVLPRIKVLFDMNNAGAAAGRHGVMLRNGSATIDSGCGVRDAGDFGIFARSAARVTAFDADFRGAGTTGIHAQTGSSVNAFAAILTGCGVRAVTSQTSAVVTVAEGNLSGGGANGVVASTGGRIDCTSANCRRGGANSSSDIVIWRGGVISAVDAIGGTSVTPRVITSQGYIVK